MHKTLSSLKVDPDVCLITYFVLHDLDTDEADLLMESEGLTVEQIQDVWESKVKDVDLIMWILLTGGRVRPTNN